MAPGPPPVAPLSLAQFREDSPAEIKPTPQPIKDLEEDNKEEDGDFEKGRDLENLIFEDHEKVNSM